MKLRDQSENPFLRGRGAQINPSDRFSSQIRDINPLAKFDQDEEISIKTRFVDVHPKTIINKVMSPDVGLEYSMNAYQGCEHGCVYCYARNTHGYWGYSSGLDFETTIMVKQNAPELLEKAIKQKNWRAAPVMMSGNTDCYQPIEKKTLITRKCLEVFEKNKHPVGIVTKNALILRDMDLLRKLNRENLVSVAISINTLDDGLRRLLEPRASSIQKRLKLVKTLSDEGIPVTVLAAPIIPGLTDHQIMPLVKKLAQHGARRVVPIVVRLNGDLAPIFKDWLTKTYPDRSQKVLNKIKSLHGGKLNSSKFGERMKGQGPLADIIHKQFEVASKLYLLETERFKYNTELFEQARQPQLRLFA